MLSALAIKFHLYCGYRKRLLFYVENYHVITILTNFKMSDPENDKQIHKRGPKHMRLRYYSSYEEATIVKLWREHLSQITSYTENLQVFRDISFGLQSHGIRLNKQEVRRRISTYRNKYTTEKTRVSSDPNYKSPWRLYPLIDSLFQPTTSSGAIQTEQQIIEKIECKVRNEVSNLPRFSRHDSRPLKFEQNPDGCPFLEGQQVMPLIKSEQSSINQQSLIIKTEALEYEENGANQQSNRSPLAPTNRILEYLLNPFDSGSGRRIRRRSMIPRTGQITVAQIEALRKENDLLAKQRDTDLKSLELKERQYLQLEQTFDIWIHQQEKWLNYLAESGIKPMIV